MASVDTPAPSAHSGSGQRNFLARLWYNKETRGVILQILTVAGLAAFIAYITSNAIANLELVGKTFSFDFLGVPANYDINQTLIEYSSKSTHLRAAIVGMLNTLIVAFCGVISATFLGFFLGVLRLSPNWLVSKMVYCFIEYTRNVPVLLHILMIHGLVTHALPKPREAQEWANIADSVFFTNRGVFSPMPLPQDGFNFVIAAFVIAIVGVFFFVFDGVFFFDGVFAFDGAFFFGTFLFAFFAITNQCRLRSFCRERIPILPQRKPQRFAQTQKPLQRGF